MTDNELIEKEAEGFFEWPDANNKTYITHVSCLLFARHIAEKVRALERERWKSVADGVLSAWYAKQPSALTEMPPELRELAAAIRSA